MYPLINKIPLSIVHDIYHYNNYSDLDLEYFKFLHKDNMKQTLITLSKAGDYYREDKIQNRGIDFMEYLFDFTSFVTIVKYRMVFLRFMCIEDFYKQWNYQYLYQLP